MILPCSDKPDSETIELLLKCGIDVEGTFKQYKGVNGFEVPVSSMLYPYKRQHSEYMTFTTVRFNGFEIITGHYKSAFYQYHASISVDKENILKALSLDSEVEAPVPRIRTAFQKEIEDLIYDLYKIVSKDAAYGGHVRDVPSILNRLMKLRKRSFLEHDRLVYGNDYYLYLFKMFPDWSDRRGEIKNLQSRMNSFAGGAWAAATVYPGHPWKHVIHDNTNEIPSQFNEWDYAEVEIFYPQDPFSMITVQEIKELIVDYTQNYIAKNLGEATNLMGNLKMADTDLLYPMESVIQTPISGDEIFADHSSAELIALGLSAVERSIDEFREKFICPFTKTYFVRPVLAANGETYSEKELLSKMNDGDFPNGKIRPNRMIASLFTLIKEKNNLKEQERKTKEEAQELQRAKKNEFSSFKRGFFSTGNETNISLFNRYKLSNDSSSSDFEKALRNAAVNGNWKDINILLTEYKVNVDGKDNGQYKRTALHWAVIKANEVQTSANCEKFIECIRVLLDAGANAGLRDGAGYTSRDYDEKGFLGRYLKSMELRSPDDSENSVLATFSY